MAITPMKSTGPITFGPSGVLFAADNVNATVTAFDLSAACSGFAYAYAVAHGFITAGLGTRALVIGAEAAASPVFTAALAAGRPVTVDVRQTLADGLALVLGHLNLAWHWRRKSAAYVVALEASTREALANSIPWHAGTWSLRLEAPKPPAKA
mgnify:CR=1 FL=1